MDGIFTSEQMGTAILSARQQERERVKAIMSLPEAAGRQDAALVIATGSSATVDEARKSLASATGSREATASSWDRVFAKAGIET